MAIPGDFTELQAGFYNAFLGGMGLETGDPVQLLQPANPLISGADADALLWQYFNFLPPASLTGSFVLSGGNQFLANYQAVLSVLEAQSNDFERTVGTACFDAWNQALRTGAVVRGSDVGTTFRVFAMGNRACSSVAASGAAAITRAYLDPIFAAQQGSLPFRPAGTRGVTFVPGFSDLQALLAKAPGRSFSVADDAWDLDVTRTWAKEVGSGLPGLWAGSEAASSLSRKFATGGVAVAARFAHVGQFTAQPGIWYSGKAFAAAYSTRNRAPWIAGKPIDWDTTFGPGGNMQRYTARLIVVDTIDLTARSLASFTGTEQEEILTGSRAGIWPFYTAGSEAGATTGIELGSDGTLSVRITSRAGVAIVLAAWVLPASEYLGQTPPSSQEMP